MKIIDYDIVGADSISGLVSKVHEMILTQDWQPIGGITTSVDISSEYDFSNNQITNITSSNFFYQAMVRYE